MRQLSNVSCFESLMENQGVGVNSVFNKAHKRRSTLSKILRASVATAFLPYTAATGAARGAVRGLMKGPYDSIRDALSSGAPHLSRQSLDDVLDQMDFAGWVNPDAQVAFVDLLRDCLAKKMSHKEFRKALDDLYEDAMYASLSGEDEDDTDIQSQASDESVGFNRVSNANVFRRSMSLMPQLENVLKRLKKWGNDMAYKGKDYGLGALGYGLTKTSDAMNYMDKTSQITAALGTRIAGELAKALSANTYGRLDGVFDRLAGRVAMKRDALQSRHDIGGDIIDVESRPAERKQLQR